MNSVNDVQTHTNKQSDRSNGLMVSGEARLNGSRRQVINDVCVSVPDVRFSRSVGSDDNKRSVVLHDSNVLHGKPVWRKTKRSRMNDDCNEQLVHKSQLADALDDRHLTRESGLNLSKQQVIQLQRNDSSLVKLFDLAKSVRDYSVQEGMLMRT